MFYYFFFYYTFFINGAVSYYKWKSYFLCTILFSEVGGNKMLTF